VTIKKVRKIADLCKFKEKNATFSCIFQVKSLLQIFLTTRHTSSIRQEVWRIGGWRTTCYSL